MKLFSVIFFILICVISSHAVANEWATTVKVKRITGYQDASGHYVWLSQMPSGCDKDHLYFDGNAMGGKALVALLLTALTTNRTVDVMANECELMEVYVY